MWNGKHTFRAFYYNVPFLIPMGALSAANRHSSDIPYPNFQSPSIRVVVIAVVLALDGIQTKSGSLSQPS